jgi:hypothetical protein
MIIEPKDVVALTVHDVEVGQLYTLLQCYGMELTPRALFELVGAMQGKALDLEQLSVHAGKVSIEHEQSIVLSHGTSASVSSAFVLADTVGLAYRVVAFRGARTISPETVACAAVQAMPKGAAESETLAEAITPEFLSRIPQRLDVTVRWWSLNPADYARARTVQEQGTAGASIQVPARPDPEADEEFGRLDSVFGIGPPSELFAALSPRKHFPFVSGLHYVSADGRVTVFTQKSPPWWPVLKS